MSANDIETKIEKLPDHIKPEVIDFIDFLINKYGNRNSRDRFKFDWEGGLSKLKDQYTSVELQHKASEWR